MFELVQASAQTYYINSPSKIGLFLLPNHHVVAIDSGNDKDAGRKLRQLLDAQAWILDAIYCTHSNADHIGGCQYLQKQTGCKVFASGIECDFTNHPVLEPSFLYGAFPCRELRNKFLMAQTCRCSPLSESDLPDGLRMISLPGHFFDMTGFRTSDDVVFLADCLSSRETLSKYRIPFIYDVAAYLDTLSRVQQMQAKLFIPSHADPCDDISALAQYNMDAVIDIAETIVSLCRQPKNSEQILSLLFLHYGLHMNMQQYVLIGSTVRSFLSWLKDKGELRAYFEKEMLFWEKS